jgi:hypothetical protein
MVVLEKVFICSNTFCPAENNRLPRNLFDLKPDVGNVFKYFCSHGLLKRGLILALSREAGFRFEKEAAIPDLA